MPDGRRKFFPSFFIRFIPAIRGSGGLQSGQAFQGDPPGRPYGILTFHVSFLCVLCVLRENPILFRFSPDF